MNKLVIVVSLPGRWSFYTLVQSARPWIYNLLPKQHHCTREIWATFLDVAWVMGYMIIILYNVPPKFFFAQNFGLYMW